MELGGGMNILAQNRLSPRRGTPAGNDVPARGEDGKARET